MRPDRRPLRCGLLLLLVLLAVASCGPRKKPPPRLTLARADFAQLAGWREDDVGAALSAFLRSCASLVKQPDDAAVGPDRLAGTVADWRAPCAAAQALDAANPAAARGFFEQNFVPFRLADNDEPEGLFTGYYEAELHGSRQPSARYRVPLLKRPPDLVTVELGLFRPDWRGQRIAGRVEHGRLKPYPTRAEIEDGALAHRGLELFWVDDPIDAFFVQIQGSGRIVLDDGTTVQIGYDGQNGRPYLPIGKVLADKGALPPEAVTMQSIRAWLAAHPGEAESVMNENQSYVFFRELHGDGPIGAEGVALTAGRSLAVDRAFLPLGVPLWLDLADPAAPGGHIRRLVVAQDTGGAIRGPVRGDLFWGFGKTAAERAGMMKDRGTYYMLLPRAVADRRAATS